MKDDLERELEFLLHRVLDPVSRVPIPPRHSPTRAAYFRRLLGGASGALAVKVLTGVAAAAAAVTVATAATNGTLDPSHVSRGISESVEACKAELQGDHGGIGQCVSAIAQHHGQSPSSDQGQPGNSGSQDNRAGKDKSHGNGNGGGNANAPGQTKTKPTPPGHGGPQPSPKGGK